MYFICCFHQKYSDTDLPWKVLDFNKTCEFYVNAPVEKNLIFTLKLDHGRATLRKYIYIELILLHHLIMGLKFCGIFIGFNMKC